MDKSAGIARYVQIRGKMDNMKVLHITTVDQGGAYKAVCRLQKGLQEQNIDSSILVRTKTQKNSDVIPFLDSFGKDFVSKTKNVMNMLFKRDEIFRDKFGSELTRHSAFQEADVIVLHWINSFLSFRTLDHLIHAGKPVIWIMHDMWPFTGGCHYDHGCGKFESHCKECPRLQKPGKKDVSFHNFEDKQRIFRTAELTIVGPSRWIAGEAEKSKLLQGQNVCYIPNCYDANVFYPREKGCMRAKYGIQTAKKVLLFGADNGGTENTIKGFSYLLQALGCLVKDQYHLVIFGNAKEETFQRLGIDYTLLGYIRDEDEMAEIYSMADVFVAPSIQEAFGYTVCEALACGTPAVAFATGGMLDQIVHKTNGYLAQLQSVEDLAKGIQFCTEHPELRQQAANLAKRFSTENVVGQYIQLMQTRKDNHG